MRHARRFALAVVALAMLFATSARAQVLQLVPSEAMVVIKIKNLQDVSSKIAMLSQQWGLANIRPELNDPLGTLLTVGGLGPGLNKNGEAAVAIMKPAEGANEPDVVVLVPVSDFKAFAAALPNNKPEGDLTVFNPGGKPVYAASVGQYAAVSPKKELVTRKGGGLQVAGVASKELNAKDLIAYANLKAIRPLVLPPLQANKQQIIDGIGQAMAQAPGANAKLAPVMKAYFGQFINAAEAFLKDADGATFGINLSKEGIATSLVAEFEAASYLGKAVTGMKNVDASFTAGIPDGKYFLYGGMVIDPQGVKLFNDFIAPIEKELANLGDDGKALAKYVDAVKAWIASTRQQNFGVVAPPAAAIGQQGLLQVVTVMTGDTAKMQAAQKDMLASQAEVMKLTGGAAMNVTSSVQPGAKTVDGVTFDAFTTKMNMNPQTPQEQQAAFMLQMLYGPNGMTGYSGTVGNDKMLVVVGGTDALLSGAIASAKQNDDALSKGTGASVVKALPQSRLAAVFLPIDTIAATVLDVMAARGMPGGVKLPPNLPPLGAAVAAEGSAVRVDGYIPAQTIQALIAAGMQMWLQGMQGGGAGQPGGL